MFTEPSRARLRSLLVVVLTMCCMACVPAEKKSSDELELVIGWAINPAAESEGGAVVSQSEHDVSGWVETQAPSTVLAALVADGQYPDIYFADNLEEVPRDQFGGAWWYRTAFEVSPAQVEKNARLVLNGINYSANLWLNGERLADRSEIRGAFRVFELDLGDRLLVGKNVLAIEVFPPDPGDFTIGFVDWNPTPPDRNMGVWRPVTVEFFNQVSLDEVFVSSDVDLDTLSSADLYVSASLRNNSADRVKVVVHGELEERGFEMTFELAPEQVMPLEFTGKDVSALHLGSPRLWWPHTLGNPEMYSMRLWVEVGGKISDFSEVDFGVREVGTYLNDEGHRGFTVNGEPVLIRGGGWVDDILLADTPEKIAAQFDYVKHMGLNTIRLEGFWGTSQYLYDLADREGLLLMPGWSCQWEWKEYLGKEVDETYGGVLTPEDIDLVATSLGDQIKLFRNHPSIFVWVEASDLLPHPDLEKRYVNLLAETDPSRPGLVSCAWVKSEVSGPSGVKMKGPYDWVPPRYWYEDTENGGAYGFNTETGPGPQPPPLESLKKMLPAENLWPIDEMWDYHCGRNEFNTPKRYVEAVNQRYGTSESVEEFLLKSQVASYEAIRPMFEAFAVNRPLSTGVIQWMLNSAWPEMFWQLYDHYLMPNGAFYGTRQACQPLNLVYNYADEHVWAVNETRVIRQGLIARAQVFDLESKKIWDAKKTFDLDSATPEKLFAIGEVENQTSVYFLDLRLTNAQGEEVSRNFYWLAAKGDQLDYENNLWFTTPTKTYADFSALAGLRQSKLEVTYTLKLGTDRPEAEVTLSNPSDALAFFVELKLVDPQSGATVLPVLWQDNYVSLLPGESRTLTAVLPQEPSARPLKLEVGGWNVESKTFETNPS